jgi:hypothetical protein
MSIPQAPTGIAVTTTSVSSVLITWVQHSNNETGFIVSVRVSGTMIWAGTTVGANVLEATKTGLAIDTLYDFQVAAYNDDGTSGYSTILSYAMPTTPLDLESVLPNYSTTPTFNSGTSISWSTTDTIHWTPNHDETATIDHYEVLLQMGVSEVLPLVATPSAGMYTVTTTTNVISPSMVPIQGQQYRYWIRAVSNWGLYSDYATTAYHCRWADVWNTATVTSTSSGSGTAGYTRSASVGVTATPAQASYAGWNVSASTTVTITPGAAYSVGAKTDYKYYIGTDDGSVHTYDPSYYSDNGTTIVSTWETVETDLGIQDTFKTVYRVSLKYIDHSSSINISVDASHDGGQTWVGAFKSVGTGDKRTHSKDYWFVITGEFLKFRVQTSSTDKHFQIIGMDVDFLPCGEAMETS